METIIDQLCSPCESSITLGDGPQAVLHYGLHVGVRGSYFSAGADYGTATRTYQGLQWKILVLETGEAGW